MATESRDDYVIRTRIRIDDPTGPGLASTTNRLTGIQHMATSVGASMTATFLTAFAVIGGAAGAGLAIRGIIGIQNEIVEAEIGMATLISAMSDMTATEAMSTARQQVVGLREDAAAGAGELQHYVRGFQMILGPAVRAGASLKEVRDLTRQSLAAGFALRGEEGLRLAPLDVTQAMTAGVSERTTPIIIQALTAIGKTSAEFNKMTGPQRMRTLRDAFLTFQEGAELMGQTWSAQNATFKDNVKELFRTVTRPLFDRWLDQLRNANTWLADNKDHLQAMAETWGPRLVAVYDRILERASGIASLTGVAIAAPTALRAGAGIAGAMGGPGGAAAAVGGVGAAAGGGALMGGGIIAATLGIVAAGFLAVKGALAEYPAILEVVGIVAYNLMLSFDNLVSAFGHLTDEGSILNIAGVGLITSFIGLTYILLVSIDLLATFTRAMGDLFQVLGFLMEAAVLMVSGDFGGARGAMSDVDLFSTQMIRNVGKGIEDAFQLERPTAGFLDDLLGTGKDSKGKLGQPKFTQTVNVANMNLNIKTEINEDPNRIAAGFEEVLDRLARFRTQAGSQPLASPA